MAPGLLPEHIGPLVDRLRAGDHQSVSLPDVAALTEVLMRSLESYFKSIDLTLYEECQSLADYIDDARHEISSLSPDNSDTVGIPRAELELEAIVQQTESATNTIMESAERIMEADPGDTEGYTTVVNDAVMQIFEACSFQDITGQRISKVVSTLQHVEERVAKLVNILGVMDKSNETESPAREEVDEDKALLNGPALEGEGIDQSEIDSLLNGKVDHAPAIEIESPEIESPEIESTGDGDSDIPQEVSKSESAPKPEPEVVSEPSPATAETASAEDIDFIFDGPADADAADEAAETIEEAAATKSVPEAEMTPAPKNDVEIIAEAEPEPVPAPEPEPEPNLIEQAKMQKAKAQAEKKQNAAAPKPVTYEEDSTAGLNPKSSENTSQSDIDALFS